MLYLKTRDNVVDHVYLWDLVTLPNQLFETGINMVIMEIPQDDTTDNVQILCPTNSYSTSFYNKTRDTVMLIKRNEYYEPIYLYEHKGNEGQIIIKKTFFSEDTKKPLKKILEMIHNVTNQYCPPLSSINPKVYHFASPINASNLRIQLRKSNYSIDGQVVNYRGKTIAILTGGELLLYVPCFPSATLPEIKIVYMESHEVWNDYATTIEELRKLHEKNPAIPCRPRIRVVDNKIVIGILTETNQFIKIDPLIYLSDVPNDDGLETQEDVNYINADLETHADTKREELTTNVSLETELYSAFKSAIRIAMHKIESTEWLDRIKEIIHDPIYLYKNKLEKIIALLKTLGKKKVQFVTLTDEILTEMKKCMEQSYCFISDKKTTLLKTHLLNGSNNEENYYVRLADELIRYKRVQRLMFDNELYMNNSIIEYNILETEIILIDSLLNEYFKQLVPYEKSRYISNIPYDEAEPAEHIHYKDRFTLDEQYKTEEKKQEKTEEILCIKKEKPLVGNQNNIWKRMFPKAKEIILEDTVFCTYYVIILIIRKILAKTVTVMDIKKLLIKGYDTYKE